MVDFSHTNEMKQMIDKAVRKGSRYQFVASFRVAGLEQTFALKPARSSSWLGKTFLDLYNHIALLALVVKSYFSFERLNEAMRNGVGSGRDIASSQDGYRIGVMHLLLVKREGTETTIVSLNRLTSDGGCIESQRRDLEEIVTGISKHQDQYCKVFDAEFVEYLRQHGLTPERYRDLVLDCAICFFRSPVDLPPYAEGSV